MQSCLIIVMLIFIQFSLLAQQPAIESSTQSTISDEMIGRRYPPIQLVTVAKDPHYGYSEKVPVLIGGGFGKGSENVYRYLNALQGPNAEPVHYDRIGTCCSFKTKNSPFGDKGLLEVYEIRVEGGQPKRLYFNWYDSGTLMIPVGLTARK